MPVRVGLNAYRNSPTFQHVFICVHCMRTEQLRVQNLIDSRFAEAISLLAIPSEVENEAAKEAATWTGRPKAERMGSARIKSVEMSPRRLV